MAYQYQAEPVQPQGSPPPYERLNHNNNGAVLKNMWLGSDQISLIEIYISR